MVLGSIGPGTAALNFVPNTVANLNRETGNEGSPDHVSAISPVLETKRYWVPSLPSSAPHSLYSYLFAVPPDERELDDAALFL